MLANNLYVLSKNRQRCQHNRVRSPTYRTKSTLLTIYETANIENMKMPTKRAIKPFLACWQRWQNFKICQQKKGLRLADENKHR